MTTNPSLGYGTDRGRRRGQNQDAYGLPPADLDAQRLALKGLLYVVADGVGGAEGGQYASRTAVDTVIAYYYSSPEPDPRQALWQAVRTANDRIHRDAQTMTVSSRMGTTVTAAVIRGAELIVAHVGDSRLYRVRGGQVMRMTQDHSWVAEEVRQGRLTQEQADRHEDGNVLLRAVGTEPDVQVDVFSDGLMPGDILALCSDGLFRVVSDAEILQHLQRLAPPKAATQLINLANKRGGPDNITVIALRPTVPRSPVGPQGESRGDAVAEADAMVSEQPRPSHEDGGADVRRGRRSGPSPNGARTTGLHVPWPIVGGVAGLALLGGVLWLGQSRRQVAAPQATAIPSTVAELSPPATIALAAAPTDPPQPTLGPTDTPPPDYYTPTPTSTAGPTQPGTTATATPTSEPLGGRVELSEPGDKLNLSGTVQFAWQPIIGAYLYQLQACGEPDCQPRLGKKTESSTEVDWCPGTKIGAERFSPRTTLRWRVVALDAARHPLRGSESEVRSFYWVGGCPETTHERERGIMSTSPPPDR